MRLQSSLLAVAPMVMLARAGVEFDLDETPRECRDICRPIADLYRGCEVDLRGDDNDREEDQLEVQCFCTNDSFDVGSVAAQCQDCIRQRRGKVNNGGGAGGNNGTNTGGGGNRDDDRDDWDDDRDDRDDWDDDRDDRDDRDDNDNDNDNDNDDDRDDDRRVKRQDDDDDWDDDRDDDAWEDINDIVRTCGFSSTSYLASATSSLPAVSVTATRPTDIAQLTTTFDPAPASETGGSGGGGGGGNNNNNDNDNDNNDDGGDGGSGAGALAPFWMAGALVAGAVAVWA